MQTIKVKEWSASGFPVEVTRRTSKAELLAALREIIGVDPLRIDNVRKVQESVRSILGGKTP